jgi:predicted transcriptional regulator
MTANLEFDADFWGDEPSVFDELDEAHEERLLLLAEAHAAAGRGVPHAQVDEWLATWGTPDFKPMPREWLK